jgi:hypothetical protein
MVAPIVINQVMALLIMLDCILRLPFQLKMETNSASTICEVLTHDVGNVQKCQL